MIPPLPAGTFPGSGTGRLGGGLGAGGRPPLAGGKERPAPGFLRDGGFTAGFAASRVAFFELRFLFQFKHLERGDKAVH